MRVNTAVWIAVLLFFGVGSTLSQPPDTLWTYVYDSPALDQAYAISPTTDGGFVVGGGTCSSQHGLLIRLDSEGEELWTCEYGDLGFGLGASIATRDGGFAMSGRRVSFGMAVVKTDSAGAAEWSVCPVPSSWGGTALVETSDSGLVVLVAGGGKHLVRFDSSGDTLWTRTIEQTAGFYDGSVLATPDGGFFLASSVRQQAYVVKTDSLGLEQWSMVFGNRWLTESVYSVNMTADGNYLVAGWQGDELGVMTSPYLALVAWTGDTIWTRVYEGLGLRRFHSVCALPDGGWVVGGESDSGWIVSRCNPDGDIVWSATYGGPMPTYYGATMCLARDGGLAIAGSRDGPGYTEEIFVVRTASVLQTNSIPHILPLSFTLLPNYPNPFNSTTHLEFTLPSTQRVSLRLYDVLGREVAVMMDEIKTAGKQEMIFDAAGLASGVYLCRLEAGGGGQVRKMVLVK